MDSVSHINGRPTYATQAVKHDTDNQVFLDNPHVDSLITVVIALGAEIWESRHRMLIMERLLETKGKVTEELIEQYVPSEEDAQRWDALKAAMTERVYSVLGRDTSATKSFTSPFPYEGHKGPYHYYKG